MDQALLIMALSFVLGAALNKGSICAVLATEELLLERRPDRFLSFFEAALWGVLCLTVIGVDIVLRPDWMDWGFLLGGSALFGFGAVVNGACAFGVVGRIGSGQIEYFLTGAGLLAGTAGARLLMDEHAMMTVDQSAALSLPAAMAGLGALILFRYALSRRRPRAFLQLTLVMAVVGAAFVALGQLHQPFSWVNALVGLPALELYTALAVVALLLGSAANAAAERRIRLTRPTLKGSVRRLAGGGLMGAGVMLVPGGNDGVLLYGMPAGNLKAFAAYAAMIAAIGLPVIAAGRVTEAWGAIGGDHRQTGSR